MFVSDENSMDPLPTMTIEDNVGMLGNCKWDYVIQMIWLGQAGIHCFLS